MSSRYLIDAYNFLHAVLLKGRNRDHFWSSSHQQELIEYFRPWSAQLFLVMDDRGLSERVHRAEESFVLRAPNADLEILRIVQAGRIVGTDERVPVEENWTVVTADRSLADRCRNHGASILSPWQFAESLPILKCSEAG